MAEQASYFYYQLRTNCILSAGEKTDKLYSLFMDCPITAKHYTKKHSLVTKSSGAPDTYL